MRRSAARPTSPVARTAAPVATDDRGSVTTRTRHPTRPATLSERGQRRMLRRLRVGRCVRDGVVDEHAERGEADRAAQVGGQRRARPPRRRPPARRGAGTWWRGSTAASRRGRSPFACHRERRCGRPRRQSQQGAEAGDGGADPHDGHDQVAPTASTRRGAAERRLAASAVGPAAASAATPTTA